jgi:hypothetical protein
MISRNVEKLNRRREMRKQINSKKGRRMTVAISDMRR